jgi:hypothetical protein
MEVFEHELNNQIESPERMRLRDLEAEGKWVFHGSGSKIDGNLEPRQAYNHKKVDSEVIAMPDDKPAVFATPSADVAIFMSIINKHNAPKGSRSGFGATDEDGFEFRATKETMDQIHNATGYVYVFDKTNFTPRSKRESLAYEEVTPNEVVMVTEKDLPKNIVIKDF